MYFSLLKFIICFFFFNEFEVIFQKTSVRVSSSFQTMRPQFIVFKRF